jgi:hypothetical protein
MTFNLILTLALAPCLGAAILLLVRRLTAPSTISQCDPDWLENFSTATYRPMQRLLSEADLKYLAAQPGITAKTVDQLRRERRRIFKSYLRNLVRDFHRLHLAARMTLLYASEDRPDLAQTLLRQRALFTWAVLTVEFRLILHAAGLGPVDVSGLIGALEDMRMNITVLTPASQSASL